jgi:hypothetical protein
MNVLMNLFIKGRKFIVCMTFNYYQDVVNLNGMAKV